MSQPYNPNNGGGGQREQRESGSGRTIQELEADLMTMWSLANELGEQLSSNRALAESLKSKASDVKGQAVHTGTGFPLRRYNVDISEEQFTSELEKFASHLVLENQNLQYENKQLSLLLKECEGTLEGVMARFRSVSHAATQHELALHSYYTSIIAQLQTSHSSATLLDSTNLSTLLTRLSELIRAALRSVNGEDTTREDEELLPAEVREAVGGSGSDQGLSDDLRGMLAELEDAGKALRNVAQSKDGDEGRLSASPPTLGESSPDFATSLGLSPDTESRGSALSSTGRAVGLPPRDRGKHRASGVPGTIGRWLGDAGKSGGYHGTEGREDWALEREGEITRLEEENQMLRKLLGVDLELLGVGGDTSEETEEDKAAMAAAKEEGRRQSEEIQAMRVTSSFMENSGLSISDHASPTTPRRTFAQSTADVASDFRMSTISEQPHQLGTSPKSSKATTSESDDWREDLVFTNPEQARSPEKDSTIGSTAHLEDVPLEDVIFTSPETDRSPGAAAQSPPRARSPINTSSPKFTAPPSPMMATSPTFSRTLNMPSLSRSPKASSTSRISMLSPTHSKTSLPSLASPQSSASLRGATGIEGGLGSPNPLASIFVKPKTDATTATTTSADPALEMGEISVTKEGSGSPMATRSLSTPVSVSSSSLGLGFSSIPPPLGSPVAATAANQEIRRTLSSPGAVPTAGEQKVSTESSEESEPPAEQPEDS